MKSNQLQKNIPNGWQESKLGSLANIYDGTHQTPEYTESGIQFYSVEHVTSNDFSNTKFISEDIYNSEIKRVKIEKGDILMTRIGDVGTTKYIDWNPKASFYVSLALIKCKNNINPRFINFAINSKNFQKEIKSRSLLVAFPNKINLGNIGKCMLHLPLLPEQNRIVSVLETWDKSIENLNKKIEIKKQVKKGLMQDLLTGKKRLSGFKDKWEVVILGDICDIKTGKKDVNEGNPNGKYPFFTCAKEHTYSDNYSFDTEAILIAGNGEVGNCLYYKGKFEAYQRTYVLSNFKKESMYIYQYLNYFFQNIINSQKQMGAMPYIKLGMLQEFEIKIPKDLTEQKEIANVLIITDKEITELERKLSIIKDQKKYLLNNLITGAIRTPETLKVN